MTEQMGLIKNRLAGWRVLIAEDNADNMRIASRFLKLAGAEIVTAENGKAALALAQQTHPMVIITDLHMPIMDGWQLCDAIKADSALRDTPVIALTADHQAVRSAQHMGFAGFIRKPLDPHKVIEQILEVLNSVPGLAQRMSGLEV